MKSLRWALAAVLVALAVAPEGSAFVLRLTAGLALAIAVVTTRRAGWLSPPLLLGGSAILFFSLLPVAAAPFILSTDPLHPVLDIAAHNVDDFAAYLGAQAETWVLQFGLLMLALHLALGAGGDHGGWSLPELPLSAVFVMQGVLAVAGTSAWVLSRLTEAGPLVRSIDGMLPPVISVAAAVVTAHVLRSRKHRLWGYGLIAFALAGLLASWHGKAPIFIAVSLLLLHVAAGGMGRRLVGLLLVTGMTGALGLVVADWIRYPAAPSLSQPAVVAGRAFHALANKVVIRQVETGGCLAGVAAAHGQSSFVWREQIYLAVALVPRVLWPEKPSLSEGRRYLHEYCGVPLAELGPGSASITLLGQPVEKGGRGGLLFAESILVLVFAILGLAAHRCGLAAVGVVALQPWLMDFDQDMALYLANAVKMALLMALIALLSAVPMLTRRWRG